jgi:pimeloyl-ACP methyl ester carboxylesterase
LPEDIHNPAVDPESGLGAVRGIQPVVRRRGTGEPVVYLQAAHLSGRWLPLHDELAQRHDLVVPEHPGFAGGERPTWLDDFSDLAIYYDELLDTLELDRVHLVGHSLGGWIAAEFAAFYPRRLKSLTLIAPMGLRVPGHPIHDIFRMTDEDAGSLLLNDDGAAYDRLGMTPTSLDARVEAYDDLTTLARLMWNPRYALKLDERLDRVRCPALLIAPDEDRIVPAAHIERWSELLPDARVEKVTGTSSPTGHLLVVQEPERAAAAISSFVAGVDRSTVS